MKHTRGPWIADGNGFEKSYNISNAEKSICDINVSREDAALIAAAPEMLVALETVLATFPEIRTDEPMSGADTIEALSLIWNSLEEAVKKAKGGVE